MVKNNLTHYIINNEQKCIYVKMYIINTIKWLGIENVSIILNSIINRHASIIENFLLQTIV